RARHRDGVDRRVDARTEVRELARRSVERRDPVAVLAVDLRERADRVDRRAVGRRGEPLDLCVRARRPGLQRTRREVVRHEMAPGLLPRAGGCARRTGRRELATDVEVFPTTTWVQTTPLICAVGRGSV